MFTYRRADYDTHYSKSAGRVKTYAKYVVQIIFSEHLNHPANLKLNTVYVSNGNRDTAPVLNNSSLILIVK